MKRFALVGVLMVSLLLSAFVVAANNNAIDITRAQEIARAQYPDATIVKIERTLERGRLLWDVKFDNGIAVYVDAQSGEVFEIEAWRGDRAADVPRGWVAPVTSPAAVDIGTDGVSLQEALSIVQSYYPDAAPFEADLERERGHDVWDIKLNNGMAVYIDARNGTVLEFEVLRGPRWDKRDDRDHKGPPPWAGMHGGRRAWENSQQANVGVPRDTLDARTANPSISFQQALETALTLYPDAALVRGELTYNNQRGIRTLAWDMMLDNGLAVYVDAQSGEVIEIEAW